MLIFFAHLLTEQLQNAFWLERPFEEIEFPDVLRKMVKDKTLGLDGFSMGFFQNCWDVVNGDIMNVFQKLFLVGKFEKSLATFIALIPKKIGALKVKDY